MATMNEQNLAQFEAQLERLIEGAFAQMFSKTVRAQDIAVQLARAMESEATSFQNGDPRPLAPDSYVIRLHPEVRVKLLQRQPALDQILSQHMVELATEAGYRLNSVPEIRIDADNELSTGDLVVEATHITRVDHSTAVMERIDAPPPAHPEHPRNPQLIVSGQTVVPLGEPIINLGRGRDNHIVLDDPYVSRHHAQMRLRFGRYTLFDVQSQTGTFVNDVRIREHQLQTGDVIRMGKLQLVYLEDDLFGDSQTHINVLQDD
jgi:pSer/pThr/pTyr-binding forkhead associated (FHA) protein